MALPRLWERSCSVGDLEQIITRGAASATEARQLGALDSAHHVIAGLQALARLPNVRMREQLTAADRWRIGTSGEGYVAVQATIQREVKGGEIPEIERDLEHGAVVFEIEFLEAGKKWELDVAEDGKLLERRED